MFLKAVVGCSPVMEAVVFPLQQLMVMFLYTLWAAAGLRFVAQKLLIQSQTMMMEMRLIIALNYVPNFPTHLTVLLPALH